MPSVRRRMHAICSDRLYARLGCCNCPDRAACSICAHAEHVCARAGRLWDLRSGHSVMVLESHVKGILSIDFSPNGYQLYICSSVSHGS